MKLGSRTKSMRASSSERIHEIVMRSILRNIEICEILQDIRVCEHMLSKGSENKALSLPEAFRA